MVALVVLQASSSRLCSAITGVVNKTAFVGVIGHSITDPFFRARRGFPDDCAKFPQFGPHFFGGCSDVARDVLWVGRLFHGCGNRIIACGIGQLPAGGRGPKRYSFHSLKMLFARHEVS